MKDKIKEHWTKHKTKYFIGGGVVLGAGITYAIMKRTSSPTPSHTPLPRIGAPDPLPRIGRGQDMVLAFSESPVSESFNMAINNTINMGGHTHKIVQNTDTGEIFSSVGDAARSAGVDITKMSRHINGHMDHVAGAVYRIIGIGTTN